MPPMRQPPAKTERTHEENQERAYIAASRRSDRSLEARVESARRASEIHKKRTGRGLRVTEQDVINEEMYEEEEDDMPLQYRRMLAGNMQTNSPEFNKRLSTYLACNGAMRSVLAQALNNSYSLPNMNMAPQYGFNQQPMYQSPVPGLQGQQQQTMHQQQQMMMLQQQQQQQQMQQPKPSMQQPNQAHRQTPYPPRVPLQHQRSASIAVPNEHVTSTSNSPTMTSENRRMSMPLASPMAMSAPNSAEKSRPPHLERPSFSLGSFSEMGVEHRQSQDRPNEQMQPYDPFPLTTEAPENWNMFMSYPNTMGGFDNSSQQGYNMGNFELSQTVDLKDLNSGINSTLGSAHIQLSQDTQSFNEGVKAYTNDSTDQGYFTEGMSSHEGETPSVTPGINWDNYINDDQLIL